MASLVAQTVKNLPEMQETSVRSLGWESLGDPLEKLLLFQYPLQYSCLENSMDRGTSLLLTEEPKQCAPN